ncbi:MAG: hypothetical protein N2C14_17750, partial [Planctomycetales bacterium]
MIHRAKAFRRIVRKDDTKSLSYVPGKGNSSLPASKPDLNPNLVRVFIDAQHDYLEDRVYLLSARIVACDQGEPVGKRNIICMTDGPPDSAAKEQQLFVDWTAKLVQALVDLAVPSDPESDQKSAPLHVIFFNRLEQRILLESLARNFPPIIAATPPLYDFLTQIAAFDSPIASYLDEEFRTFKNYPMTCQSLHSVATFLKFNWNEPQPFRDLFHARMFDYVGKMELDGVDEWYTKRSRFNSSIPLEYAYAAWKQLPQPAAGKGDEFAEFRPATAETITAFQDRRLEALEHVADSIQGNPHSEKTPFNLPNLADYQDVAPTLARALDEFVTIERLVELTDWKTARAAPPERRVLAGETLLVQYREEDQEPGVAEQNRENERRRLKWEEYRAEHKKNNPGKQFRRSKEQIAETDWSPDGFRVRLRIETSKVDCDLHEVLSLCGFRQGDHLIVYPRWTVDERLPEDQRKEFTPSPKQLLYGMRAELLQIEPDERDDQGRVTSAFADVAFRKSFSVKNSRGFIFGGIDRTLNKDCVYTLDPCPNSWYGYFCLKVVEGLCAGESNTMHDRLDQAPASGDGGGEPGQVEFLAGLDAYHEAGLLHDFE